ncbi:MAG TPA: DUF4296 domain-containing protein [Bacteroidia bacterium]|nr:DUF4296 domain-containing protein [Bacteroidia bacterium]
MRFRLLAVFVLLVASCSHKGNVADRKPDDLIPEDKMIGVLVDVHLLEASLVSNSVGPLPRPQAGNPGQVNMPVVQEQIIAKKIPYYDVFKKNGVTQAQYESSLRWYTQHPDVLDKMYDAVIEQLVRRQAAVQAGK